MDRRQFFGESVTGTIVRLVLLSIVVGIVWYLPPLATLVFAEIAAVLAFIEYADLAAALGAHIPRAVSAFIEFAVGRLRESMSARRWSCRRPLSV